LFDDLRFTIYDLRFTIRDKFCSFAVIQFIARSAYGIVEDCRKIHPLPPPAGDTAAASAQSTNQQINRSTNPYEPLFGLIQK
jgi:hypothetical protein